MNSKTFGAARRVRSARVAAAIGLALAAIAGASCGSETLRQSTASSYLIIVNLEGANGADGDSAVFDHVLKSDVSPVFEDPGRVTMTAEMKDVNPVNPAVPTTNNSITVNRYRVEFRRADGRNTPGVDVPYAFDGAITFTVGVGATQRVPFSLVRAQSKLEPPLSALERLGGSVVISTLADVTFYGRDQTGREVTVKGTIGVNFADWAND